MRDKAFYGRVVRLLQATRLLLDEPERWTQGAEARNAQGEPVKGHSPDAVCYCLLTAVWQLSESQAQYGYTREHRMTAIDALDDTAGVAAEKYQDNHSHEEVLAVIDRALIAAKQMEVRAND